jgi:DNA-binding transcriptional ArsR family regulator
MADMVALDVIDDPAVASMALSPTRNRLLAELREPASAAMLAERVGLARQKVTYHLNALEAGGLVREVERRRWGGITERLFEATAASYVVSPDALGEMGGDPDRVPDRLSARYLVALAARMVREVGGLLRRAEREDKRLATLGIDTVIAFRSPAERAAFTDELTRGVAALAARYHDEDGRPHRLVVAAHPVPSS